MQINASVSDRSYTVLKLMKRNDDTFIKIFNFNFKLNKNDFKRVSYLFCTVHKSYNKFTPHCLIVINPTQKGF